MGKTLVYGKHEFPASAGFTGSSGKVASVRPFTRKIGVRTPKIKPGAPVPKVAPRVASSKLAQGPALQPRVKPVTQVEKSLGKGALYPGYKRGGAVKGRC